MVYPERNRPEFCPNAACRFHDREIAEGYQWYALFGSFLTRARGRIQRFRCRECGTTCSTQTFSVHYWTHYTNDLPWLLDRLSTSSGLRQIGRVAGVTHRVIQNRCRRLARNALAVMDAALAALEVREHLAFDGFESFTRSQYHPNHITHLTGCASQFIYAAVHTLFRRKGSMTDEQKQQRERIDALWRPSSTVGEQTSQVLADVQGPIDTACRTRSEPLELRSDEHPAYPKAIRSVDALSARLADGSLVHKPTSSKAARTAANPLSAVNYVDRQLRANLGEYARETIHHGREVNAQMERFSIFMVVHNFLTPHRVTGHARVHGSQTHADVAGVGAPRVAKILQGICARRHVYTHLSGVQWWIRRIWLRLHENPPAVRSGKGGIEHRSVCGGQASIPRYLLA